MPSETIIKTTCARDCYDACGIAVHTRDGSITKVIGDPDHPVSRGKLCGKCAIAYNGAWRDPALRLSSPLRRAGPKGEGKFVAISWDEALAEISERFRQLVAQDNAHTILHTHYTGTVGLLNIAFPLRFFHRLGATEVDPDTVCNKAGHAALDLTFGTSVVGFDPRTARDSNCILVWGANPSHSAPHQDQRFIADAAAAGTTIIVVDPIEHTTASASDMFLKLRPGTDAALGFAFLNVMQSNGLIDWEFVDAHVLGAKSLMETIDRTTPAVAEKLCGVPAELIEKAARAYAEGPRCSGLDRVCSAKPMAATSFGFSRRWSPSAEMSGSPARASST
ncbi:molybdopterin-dependent oxidoreductase [Methyloceanibacter sp. wino2]|uniref:molybdopterin-dependent oxidoreductase n=1 Tax=Methyloceanibacter sp. wino2 TaxID=2170729 RepID=UPI000D3EA587|nr:molybdopterin-dependent oxidoreductase [Methyloceanibacter sp. wino2]